MLKWRMDVIRDLDLLVTTMIIFSQSSSISVAELHYDASGFVI
jgi:hypothetical protein